MKRKAAQAATDKLMLSFSPGGRQISTLLSPGGTASETRSQRASTEAVRRQNGSKPTRASRSTERKSSATPTSRGTATDVKKKKGSSSRKRSPSTASSSENEEEEQEVETEEEKKSDSENTEEIEISNKTKREISSKQKKGTGRKERSVIPVSRKRSESASSEVEEQEKTDSEEDARKGQGSTKKSKAGSRTRQKAGLSKSKRTSRSKSASTDEENSSVDSEDNEKQRKSSPGKSKKVSMSGRQKEVVKKLSKSAEASKDEDSDNNGVKDKNDGKSKDKKDATARDSSETEEEKVKSADVEKANDRKGKRGSSNTLTAILEKIDKVKEQAASSKSSSEQDVKVDTAAQMGSETSLEKKLDEPGKSDSNETKPKPVKPNRELIRLGLIPSTNKRDLQREKAKAPPRSSARKSQRSESNSTRTLESNSESSDEDEDNSENDSESESEDESKEEDDDDDDECVIVDEVKPKSRGTTVVARPTDVTASADAKKTASVAILQPNTGNLHPSLSATTLDRIRSVPGLTRADEQLRGTTAELATRLMRLEAVIAAMKKDFAEKLMQKDKELVTLKQTARDELVRLNNELKFKTEQLEELNKAAEKNMELEARIGFMLSSPEAYEQEVTRVKEEADKAKEEEEMDNEDEGDGDNGEADEDKEEGSAKKRKRSRGKKRKHEDDGPNEVDEIEQLFVGADPEPLISDVVDEPVEPPEVELTVPAVSRPVPLAATGVAALNDAMSAANRGRHEIRRLMTKLEEETKIAGKMEADRRERVRKQREKHLVTMGVNEETQQPMCERLVLEFGDEERQNAVVEVSQQLLKHLKPHQVEAVEFMWDNLVESLEQLNSEEGEAGSGCILAHCMGLGKTLSVISLVHTLLKSPAVSFRSCLILAPLNAVLNWVSEWDKWVDKKQKIKVYELASRTQSVDRTQVLSDWKKTGGILVMGYQLFRILSSYSGRSRKAKQIYSSCLIDPGADLIVCDEGHVLKNDSSALSKCVNKVRSRRRIVLTGTPLQNNLIEYHCMVSFVKPNLLGSRREFCNRFVNPITNGQHADSTQADVRLMKRRAHVIHEMLAGCVQRRDYTALVKFLPPKHEYVISIHLSPLQIDLYQEYLDRFTQVSSSRNQENGSALSTTGSSAKIQSFGLFADYQVLMRIWTHPWVLKLDEIRQDKKQALTLSDDDELDDSVMYTSSSDEAVESDEVTTIDDDPDLDVNDDDVVSTDGVADAKQTRRTRSSRKNGKSEKSSDKSGATSADDSKKPTAAPAAAKRKRKVSSDSTSSGTATEERKDAICMEVVEMVPENGTVDAGEMEASGTGKVRILGGEVIRPWQTRSRSKGNLPEFDFGALSMAQREEQWWDKYVKDDDKVCLEHSGKLVLLFEILAMAQQLGDKVLVFSQSLLSLDLIEDFLFMKTEQAKLHNAALSEQETKTSIWIKDEDYVRMDGSTCAQSRRRFTANFSDASNERLRLFLISTKAGGLGINLDTANRVIIFDASWNPSHDVQSIFRVYRFGQLKPVFIYRFLAQGTMEEKIYERQVTKETLSQRVVDEHQIDRHFTAADLRELYTFKPDGLDDPNAPQRPIPAVPKDVVLAELLSTPALSPWIVNYHEHDSLLENRPEENLSEEERKTAWDEYEREKLGIYEVAGNVYSAGTGFSAGNYTITASTAALVAQTTASAGNYLPRISYPANNYGYTYNRSAWNNAVANFNNVTKVNLPAPTSYNKATQGVVTALSEKELEAAANAAVHGIPQHLRARFGFQIQQMPKVVHEILKYNPSISAENLQKRLVAFLGMHTRTTPNVEVISGSSSSNGSNNSRNITVDLT